MQTVQVLVTIQIREPLRRRLPSTPLPGPPATPADLERAVKRGVKCALACFHGWGVPEAEIANPQPHHD